MLKLLEKRNGLSIGVAKQVEYKLGAGVGGPSGESLCLRVKTATKKAELGDGKRCNDFV